jgi:hypothetical protein
VFGDLFDEAIKNGLTAIQVTIFLKTTKGGKIPAKITALV